MPTGVWPSLRPPWQHYGFLISPTKPDTARHKVKVENGAHYLQRNFMAGQDIADIHLANPKLPVWVYEIAGTRDPGTTHQPPLCLFLDHEQAALLPLAPAGAPDLVDRDFAVARPNQLWVADITHISTWTASLYLTLVVDAWSRRVVGWSMATHLRTVLVLDALDMAIMRRRPAGVIHHSDQGSQHTSITFGKRCREAHVRPSMGSAGDCGVHPERSEGITHSARASSPPWNAS